MSKDQQQETAIVKRGEFAVLAQGAQAVQSIIQDNLGPGGSITPFDLDKIRVPAAGATSWAIPTLEGEKAEKEITGIIVFHRPPRAYWRDKYTGDNNPPDCKSNDGFTGEGDPGGSCRTCPLAQLGSGVDQAGAQTDGQACKQMRFLFMFREGDLLPVLVVLPPTSVKPIERYFLRLTSNGIPFYGVITRLTLEVTKNKGGIKYSRVVPAMVGKLSPEQIAAMKTQAATFRGIFETVNIEAEDYKVSNDEQNR